jgi:hypothetical protein
MKSQKKLNAEENCAHFTSKPDYMINKQDFKSNNHMKFSNKFESLKNFQKPSLDSYMTCSKLNMHVSIFSLDMSKKYSYSEPNIANLLLNDLPQSKGYLKSKSTINSSNTNKKKSNSSHIRELKLTDKLKFQFKTNNKFWYLVKQVFLCKSQFKVNRFKSNILSRDNINNSSKQLNSSSSLSKKLSKSLDCLLVRNNLYSINAETSNNFHETNTKVNREPTTSALMQKLLNNGKPSIYPVNDLEKIEQISTNEKAAKFSALALSSSSSSDYKRQLSKFWKKTDYKYIRYISESNLTHSENSNKIEDKKPNRKSLKAQKLAEADDRALKNFLSKKQYSQRRNAICTKIDKLYHNKHLVNYMEHILREDYIRNFLI